jgi:hypothetical protein
MGLQSEVLFQGTPSILNYSKSQFFKFINFYQSLVDLVVIGVELDRKHHGSIPCNCDREGAEIT